MLNYVSDKIVADLVLTCTTSFGCDAMYVPRITSETTWLTEVCEVLCMLDRHLPTMQVHEHT